MKMKDDTTIERAIEYFGAETQEKMVIGEIGELLTLFGREAQGRATVYDWIDEIADVSIMLAQLTAIKKIDPNAVAQRIDMKMARLAGRVSNGED